VKSLQDTDRIEAQRKRLVQLLDELVRKDGVHPCAIPGVELVRETSPSPRKPVVYKPRIIVVGQGRKKVYVGDQVLNYDPYNYLVLSVPLPVECEFDCSPEEPMLVVAIEVNPTMIGEMILEMDESLPVEGSIPPVIYTTPLDERMGGAVIRLLECLKSSRDSKILGRQIVREIVYLVLMGEQGAALRALAARNENFHQIARVLQRIHVDPAQDFSVEALARKAGMSVSAFHHTFKQMTATSPLQYVKRIRLDKARQLMVHEGHNVSTAAMNVGYESVSQFSREFKRLFGASPAEEAGKLRAQLGGGMTASPGSRLATASAR